MQRRIGADRDLVSADTAAHTAKGDGRIRRRTRAGIGVIGNVDRRKRHGAVVIRIRGIERIDHACRHVNDKRFTAVQIATILAPHGIRVNHADRSCRDGDLIVTALSGNEEVIGRVVIPCRNRVLAGLEQRTNQIAARACNHVIDDILGEREVVCKRRTIGSREHDFGHLFIRDEIDHTVHRRIGFAVVDDLRRFGILNGHREATVAVDRVVHRAACRNFRLIGQRLADHIGISLGTAAAVGLVVIGTRAFDKPDGVRRCAEVSAEMHDIRFARFNRKIGGLPSGPVSFTAAHVVGEATGTCGNILTIYLCIRIGIGRIKRVESVILKCNGVPRIRGDRRRRIDLQLDGIVLRGTGLLLLYREDDCIFQPVLIHAGNRGEARTKPQLHLTQRRIVVMDIRIGEAEIIRRERPEGIAVDRDVDGIHVDDVGVRRRRIERVGKRILAFPGDDVGIFLRPLALDRIDLGHNDGVGRARRELRTELIDIRRAGGKLPRCKEAVLTEAERTVLTGDGDHRIHALAIRTEGIEPAL